MLLCSRVPLQPLRLVGVVAFEAQQRFDDVQADLLTLQGVLLLSERVAFLSCSTAHHPKPPSSGNSATSAAGVIQRAFSCLISSTSLSRSSSLICRSMLLSVSIAVSFPGSPGHSYENANGGGTYTLRN